MRSTAIRALKAASTAIASAGKSRMPAATCVSMATSSSDGTGSLIHSAASFSASFSAFSAAAFASTSSTMCSTMSAPAIVWSVFPAR